MPCAVTESLRDAQPNGENHRIPARFSHFGRATLGQHSFETYPKPGGSRRSQELLSWVDQDLASTRRLWAKTVAPTVAT